MGYYLPYIVFTGVVFLTIAVIIAGVIYNDPMNK